MHVGHANIPADNVLHTYYKIASDLHTANTERFGLGKLGRFASILYQFICNTSIEHCRYFKAL